MENTEKQVKAMAINSSPDTYMKSVLIKAFKDARAKDYEYAQNGMRVNISLDESEIAWLLEQIEKACNLKHPEKPQNYFRYSIDLGENGGVAMGDSKEEVECKLRDMYPEAAQIRVWNIKDDEWYVQGSNILEVY